MLVLVIFGRTPCLLEWREGLTDVKRIPVVLSVDNERGGGGDYAKDTADGEDHWQEWKLNILSLAGTSVSGEVRDVASQSSPRTSDRRHAREPEVRPGAAMDLLRDVEQLSAATGLVDDPAECCDRSDGRSDQLDHKEVLQARWWNQEERQLNNPEEEVRDHAVRCDARVCR